MVDLKYLYLVEENSQKTLANHRLPWKEPDQQYVERVYTTI